jgi:spermidine/putrescine transport system ATP-binding protein
VSGAEAKPAIDGERVTPAIDVERVTKVFGAGTDGFTALDDVSVAIRSNEFFTLLGPSGCGKTTLLRLIAGFEHPTSGVIRLDGADISALPPYRRPVNTVFQNYALFPHMTVEENVGFGLEMLGKPRAEIDRTVADMLRLVRMDALAKRKTHQISGGQQQRVALARALAPHPKVLLLDEPLSALDAKLRREMQSELKRMQTETGITFVFVTHDQEEALTMSDRVAVMSAGRILQIGSPREIYDQPANRFVAAFIGETNFLDGVIGALADGLARVDLKAGGAILAPARPGDQVGAAVTVAIRPEQADLSTTEATFTGELDCSVYCGMDTQVHLRLADDTEFMLRMTNRASQPSVPPNGAWTGVRVAPGAARIVEA